ncbi:unnamed protein product [Penicillium salamii]|uniref:Uncharacterized protein n=1 Tax=Penicillium salamii TaxID=1612424 RepID=A0A9W4J1U0_9EURO|nr:unnamed protein product [Penicillium salamii]
MPLTTAKKWRSRDDASSIYSRPPETPKSILPSDKSLQRLKIRHDRPDINSLDHQIALARGSTIVLEMTRARLQRSKFRHRLSLPEAKQEKIHQFNQQEAENEFYRTCHDVFQELSVAVLHIIESSQEFIIQCPYDPDLKIAGNLQIWQQIHGLRDALERSRSREASAEREWKRKCNIRPSWGPSTCWI